MVRGAGVRGRGRGRGRGRVLEGTGESDGHSATVDQSVGSQPEFVEPGAGDGLDADIARQPEWGWWSWCWCRCVCRWC